MDNLEGYFGLDGITFADFSGTVNLKEELILQNFPRLLILGSIIFQDFPGRGNFEKNHYHHKR